MSRTLFGEERRLERLNNLRDPLVAIKLNIDWKIFQKELIKLFPEKDNLLGGRPAYSKLLLFKILLLQEYIGLSDKSAEYQITDRLSFMRFLDLSIEDQVPDSNTIWNFREALKIDNKIECLFEVFVNALLKKGLIVNKGSTIDATIMKAPIQRNSRDENEEIKNGVTPKDWSEKKGAHKDIEATWTEKHGKQFYGYKNHIKMDNKSKIITKTFTTVASTSDSKAFVPLLSDSDMNKPMHMDSGYDYDSVKTVLAAGNIKMRIQKRAVRNKPLTEKENKRNHRFAKIRCRVEHVFGAMRTLFGQPLIRTIGLQRARVKITLRSLTYNIQRASYLMG